MKCGARIGAGAWLLACGVGALGTIACAQGDELDGGNEKVVLPEGGLLEAGPMPSSTTSAMPTSVPTDSMPPMDARAPEGDAATGDSGPPPSPCAVGLKSCGGICVAPAPGVGCSLDDCVKCSTVTHGSVSCVDEACEVACEEGYLLVSGDRCVASAECSDGELNNAETDVDCGGGGCPRCDPGKNCMVDGDCARGPCESGVCGCTPQTCSEVTTCSATTDDGCGGTIDCRDACAGATVCFNDDCCTPATQCPAGTCNADDGCGGRVDCSGDCPTGQVCHNNACCTPQACPAGACGSSGDGCGGTRACGNCGSGQTCQQGQCCTRKTAANCAANQCGMISDGCGGMVGCPACPGSNPCVNGQCCTRKTTADCGANQCGMISDGCGGTIDCGGCGGSVSCVNGTCCSPSACTRSCGYQSDGCGGNACTLCQSGAQCNNNQDCASNDCRFSLLGCGLLNNCCR